MPSDTHRVLRSLQRQINLLGEELARQLTALEEMSALLREQQTRLLYAMQKVSMRKAVGSALEQTPRYDVRTLYEFYAMERETFIAQLADAAKNLDDYKKAHPEEFAEEEAPGPRPTPEAVSLHPEAISVRRDH